MVCFCLPQVDAEVLAISIQNVSEGGQSYLRIRLQCNSMDLAAELVQDLAKYFKLEELESEADFPAEFREFEEVILNHMIMLPTVFIYSCYSSIFSAHTAQVLKKQHLGVSYVVMLCFLHNYFTADFCVVLLLR